MSMDLVASTFAYPWTQSLARWEPLLWDLFMVWALRFASSMLPHTMACLSPPVRRLYSIATHEVRFCCGFSFGRMTCPVYPICFAYALICCCLLIFRAFCSCFAAWAAVRLAFLSLVAAFLAALALAMRTSAESSLSALHDLVHFFLFALQFLLSQHPLHPLVLISSPLF